MQPRLNPKKLLLSKWTAIQPQQKEKHFIVTQIANDSTPIDERDLVTLEAVYTRRSYRVDWHTLLDITQWQQGWH
ncbi:TIGR02450 family Trp-rich protein [Agitococcus lubricus]|nr:TIGR02450 family Trp-rich protein [Agitococcus lubricus]